MQQLNPSNNSLWLLEPLAYDNLKQLSRQKAVESLRSFSFNMFFGKIFVYPLQQCERWQDSSYLIILDENIQDQTYKLIMSSYYFCNIREIRHYAIISLITQYLRESCREYKIRLWTIMINVIRRMRHRQWCNTDNDSLSIFGSETTLLF